MAMPPRHRDTPASRSVRAEAEERLARLDRVEPESVPPDIRRLMHELSVHQIELEMQTEQLRQTHADLEAARTRYFDLYDQAPVAYVVLDSQGRIIECNRKATELLGGVASRLMGRALNDFVFPAGSFDFAQRRDQMLAGAELPSFEMPMRRLDKTTFWAQLQMNSTRSETGDSQVTRIAISDISDRRRMEDEASRLAAIVRSSEQAIFSQQLTGEISSWNPAAERLFQHAAATIVGAPLSILFPPERMAEEKHDRELVRLGQQLSYETVRIRRDGIRIPVFLSVSPILDGSGRIIGISHIARDISEDLATGSGCPECWPTSRRMKRSSGRRTDARTSSSPPWLTSCETRWPRSGMRQPRSGMPPGWIPRWNGAGT